MALVTDEWIRISRDNLPSELVPLILCKTNPVAMLFIGVGRKTGVGLTLVNLAVNGLPKGEMEKETDVRD